MRLKLGDDGCFKVRKSAKKKEFLGGQGVATLQERTACLARPYYGQWATCNNFLKKDHKPLSRKLA